MKSIRWKIILTSMAVVFVPIYLLNRHAVEFFDLFTRTALEKQMVDTAFIAAEQYKLMVLRPTAEDPVADAEFDHLIKIYGPQIEAEICLVSGTGVVLFDSGTNSLVGQDISSRREISKALQGDYGHRWELTPDRQYIYYYVALPIHEDDTGEVVGVSYVFRHTAPIIHAIKQIYADQRLATASALGVAVLIAAILAQTLTRRLRKLTKASVAFAQGTAPFETDIKGRDEIGELGGAMKQMAAEIEKRNHYNRDFISTVMHELKMPLTAIKGAAELLEQGAAENPAARGKFISNIRFEVDRMVRMVAELAELTKLDVEVLRGQKETVDYVQFVREVAERLEPTFDQHHAEFRVVLPEKNIPVKLLAGRVEQVISNLLENAFRYTPVTGSVELRVEEGPEQNVITRIRDTGCGISSSNLDKVFDRFFTTEPKDKPKDYGSGLGLAIAKSIVENHGGTIWVETEAGKGACFSFSLPVAA